MKYLKSICLILLFSFLGEVCRFFIPLTIPASIYGIALLFAALMMKIVRLEEVRETGAFFTSLLPLLFCGADCGTDGILASGKAGADPLCVHFAGGYDFGFCCRWTCDQVDSQKGGEGK